MRLIALLFSLLCLASTASANNPFNQTLNKPTLLSPDQAFVINVLEITPQQITLDVQIAPGYYLYRDQFTFTPDPSLNLGNFQLPAGISKTDEFFGRQYVYIENTLITLPIIKHREQASLIVAYRGCAPIGVCYPPMEKKLTLSFNNSTSNNSTPDVNAHTQASNILAEQHFTVALLIFFGLGLLLALTPCVLPMLPILSSIILGQKNISRGRAAELSFIYVIASALTFSLAGVGAALLGENLQSSMQQPWVLVLTALLLVGLAVLLLGNYPLQLPQKIHNQLDQLSRKQKGGTLAGVISLGVISALVVSPCVTPPLIGALIYIAESGNLYLGGAALFMLGLGMGLPLILFAVFGIHLLPKQGPWLRGIKILFAVLLIGLAISLIARLMPSDLYEHTSANATPAAFDYILIKNLSDLEAELAAAQAHNQPVVLDFYASWCVSCVKMEQMVFPDPSVQALLQNVRFLKADVTAHDADDKALQQHFGVYGPPALIFFSQQGTVQPELTWVGEIKVVDLVAHLQKWKAAF